MKTKLNLTPKTNVQLSLRAKLIIGVSCLLFVIVGVVVFIYLNLGTSKNTIALAPSSVGHYFDGSNDKYVDFKKAKDTKLTEVVANSDFSITITFWMKWVSKTSPEVGNNANLISVVDSTGDARKNGVFWVQHDSLNSKIQFAIKKRSNKSITVINSTTNPVVGTWYHVACVCDAQGADKKMYIYINGVLESSQTIQGRFEDFTSLSKLNMGRWCNSLNKYRKFNGYLDEISIWKTPFSSNQIRSIMDNPTSVTGVSYDADGLVGYWSFDNNLPTDRTSNHIDGLMGSSFNLPIELISFTGEKGSNNVELKWETVSELNNDYFTIERSNDGKVFTPIGQKKGAGKSNTLEKYSILDAYPLNEINYYRLKQTDYNGDYEYSNIIAVNFSPNKDDAGKITVGPNPFYDNINVNYISEKDGVVTVSLYDMSGKVVNQKQVEVIGGSNSIYLKDVDNLQTGMYLIGVTDGRNKTPLVKLMKSN